MACDICGKTGIHLERFRNDYQTKNIKEACSDCVKEVNDHIWKIRALNNKIEKSFTLRFIENLKGKFSKR
jgi:hypothetical protein